MTSSQLRIAVIGSGMAGATCARRLSDAGAQVHLFEKSRGVGGRMATTRRRWCDEAGVEHEAAFDHGAPGFSAHSAAFAKFVHQRVEAKDLVRWMPRMAAESLLPLAGYDGWIAGSNMPALCAGLIGELPVTFGQTIDAIRIGPDGWRVEWLGETLGQGYDRVVLAMPPVQAAKLLEPHRRDWAQRGRLQPMQPCWTLFGVADELAQMPDWDAAWPRTGPLAWVVRNEKKPGRQPVEGRVHWVAHANAAWSQTHLEAPDDAVHATLLSALENFLGEAPDWRFSTVHRWRYASVARPDACTLQPFWFDDALGLGVCGDFLGGAGVEGAWLSGDALAEHISQDCGALARLRVPTDEATP